jgi:hypothetical protein
MVPRLTVVATTLDVHATRCPMRIRLILAAAATLALVACGDSATAPRQLSPTGASMDITCRSGYHIATRDDGGEYCAPDAQLESTSTTNK